MKIWMDDAAMRRAYQVGKTLMEGVQREIENQIGVRVEDMVRIRMIRPPEAPQIGMFLIMIESDWVKPTRS